MHYKPNSFTLTLHKTHLQQSIYYKQKTPSFPKDVPSQRPVSICKGIVPDLSCTCKDRLCRGTRTPSRYFSQTNHVLKVNHVLSLGLNPIVSRHVCSDSKIIKFGNMSISSIGHISSKQYWRCNISVV